MKNFSKKVLVASAVVGGLALGSTVLSNPVSAHMNGASTDIIQRIAQRFNLNEADVQTFFDDMRTERQQQRQADMEARLDEAVTAGVITAEQKALVIAKMAEHHDEMEAERGEHGERASMSAEERQTEREEHRAERESHRQDMESWAESNGIDWESLQTYLHPAGGPQAMRGAGRM